jgi:hypothetical protein
VEVKGEPVGSCSTDEWFEVTVTNGEPEVECIEP